MNIFNGRVNIRLTSLPVHMICANGPFLNLHTVCVSTTEPRQAITYALAHEAPLLCPGAVICLGAGKEITDVDGNGHLLGLSLEVQWGPPTHARILLPKDEEFPRLILSYGEITYLHDRDDFPTALDFQFARDRYVRVNP